MSRVQSFLDLGKYPEVQISQFEVVPKSFGKWRICHIQEFLHSGRTVLSNTYVTVADTVEVMQMLWITDQKGVIVFSII